MKRWDIEMNGDDLIASVRLQDGRWVEADEAIAEVDNAYVERNRLVAFLARLFPSGTRKTAIEGWDPAWHGCVFIDTPDGQMSWHYHERDAGLFADLPPYEKPWDGHTTPEKYERLERLKQRVLLMRRHLDGYRAELARHEASSTDTFRDVDSGRYTSTLAEAKP